MKTAPRYTRRELLQRTGAAALGGMLAPHVFAASPSAATRGAIVGDLAAAKAGEKILAEGGNAIDAAIATAFAAGICSPSNCGVGGYGGHAMIGLAGGKKITAIDFNSAAPQAARADMFPLDAAGRVKGNANIHGWLAAGVPGTLAGLELVLTRYGTRSLRQVMAPAIQMCEDGTHVVPARAIDNASPTDPRSEAEPGSKLPPERRRNLALGKLLRQLAERNSTESFYRGDIAATIAAAFARHGGLVTAEDLAAYQARELSPLRLEWNGATIHTVPLPSTGPLLVEACAALKAMGWSKLSPEQRLHAKVEALRTAWADRLRYFGDPTQVDVPMEKLMSSGYAAELAEKISLALKAERPVPLQVDPSHAGGTTNISAADAQGNLIAITLTHGGGYGAQVVVDELGMVLGHGMSRFDPRPGLPNSPAPGKRPITNMCPSLVTRAGLPVLAVGGAGGTRIPNSVYEVLLNYTGLGASMEDALAAPRIDANGTLDLGLEKSRPDADEAQLKKIGYRTKPFIAAFVSGATFDPKTGATRAKAR